MATLLLYTHRASPSPSLLVTWIDCKCSRWAAESPCTSLWADKSWASGRSFDGSGKKMYDKGGVCLALVEVDVNIVK